MNNNYWDSRFMPQEDIFDEMRIRSILDRIILW